VSRLNGELVQISISHEDLRQSLEEQEATVRDLQCQAEEAHRSQRMRRALHLGVRKALGVLGSHYQVDFEAVSSGYVVPVGVEDEEAMNRADALATPAADALAEDFMDFLFPDAPGADDPQS
jgi:hypothetical protein